MQWNILFIASSSFDGANVWPVKHFGLQPMSFGGVLLAFCVMVAKEAHKSFIKDMIITAKSVANAEWEGTYSKETGGILTVHLKLDEPIHKIAICSVELWKELDNTVFKLPKEKRAT